VSASHGSEVRGERSAAAAILSWVILVENATRCVNRLVTTPSSAPSAAIRRTVALVSLCCAMLLTGAGFRAAGQGPVIQAPERIPQRMPAGFVPAADDILTRAYPLGGPGAVALIAKDGRPVFRRSVGLADLEFSIMLEADMVLRIGSVTKQFTAAAVLLLADRGKLNLADDVTRYVPDLDTGWHHVTLEHLLAGTSGLPNYTDRPQWQQQWTSEVRPEQIIDLVRHVPLEFEPGTKWRDSDSAYVLLGQVIEKVSGQPYRQFLREQVLLPLGLSQTVYDDPGRVLPRRVHGYVRSGDGFLNAPCISPSQLFSAGALVSTVDDLARWDAALDAPRLLKPATVSRMFSASQGTSDTHALAMGWVVTAHDGHPAAEQSGATPGFSSHVVRLASDRLYVAVLSNVSSRMAERTAHMLAALALGRPFRNPVETPVPAATLDTYVGVYRDGTVRWTVTRAGSHLQLSSGTEPIQLAPSSATEFFEPDGPLRVSFVADDTGHITALRLGGWGEAKIGARE
jgi:D-alanyl-D-alanine carboxypeptidase